MHEKCKSCGTIFEVNESILTNNIRWLKCGVCNQKWVLSSTSKENPIENTNKTEKVKQELASIKSIVEDKSKILAKTPNPVLDQKNKTVAEIASELSLSKLNENNKNKIEKTKKANEKKKNNRLNILPLFVIALCLILFLAIFFRSTLLSYSFFYFPNHTQTYIEKINSLFTKIDMPILADTKNLNLTNFIAKVQEQEIRFTGAIKNISKRPMLVPRIKILGVREDRKIIMEKILTLEDKIIFPNSEISFNKLVRVNIQNQKDNVTVKATLLKKIF
ncbi:MAG: hypothetical protein CBD59_02360 [Alphaproteobacteria bacterium TMED199]|nr:MAG: hypothetical protein CBD59_02360 [Alphaproteobacteria bacterium TMED199]